MPHSYGYRARTRALFARAFKTNGPVHLSTYLTNFKIGEYVDVVGNAAVHKGMPFKYYHGRTGIVWNVTKRAIGVEINKRVRHRIIKKRIHVRIDHVKKSSCRDSFLKRVKENDKIKHDAHVAKLPVPSTKRLPVLPKAGAIIKSKGQVPETCHAIPYEHLV
uniref:Large ribosomal subunit protein eL21 n=1 Tax=Cyanophora paradoxa TaxID=2762 RepID=RL21_CYAPA|nr:RecName: Full=Large ribosomal subunit protein eL21; AltName: Full=60S ribosomal protein L21 [Cyanophora paradoxa]AAC64142.1 ribosomal protein L21E [Cyanophora paradoxa]|eukprot:tig00000640_g2759.t1